MGAGVVAPDDAIAEVAEPDIRRRAPGERTPLGREIGGWSARNSSKGSLLPETIRCLQFVSSGHSLRELQRAIMVDDLLGKRTWQARRTYWRLISWRYLTPPGNAAIPALVNLAQRGAADPFTRGALYFHFCLADRFTYDVATELLWTVERNGRGAIATSDVLAFLKSRVPQHQEVLRWSQSTHDRLASSVLSALRDFGRLSGRANKRLAQPPLPDTLLLYVCKFLAAEGKSAREIVAAPEFRLWAQREQDVGIRLATLSQRGLLRFEWSGDIAVLDLGGESFETYARHLG